ncbi:unnamed protein product [Moneuplotes crassus]|uniref:Uncharacterized protein n=1 Tax=Euplotes crassus TaxID=5936 RepID=A0AAD1U5N1_EUPCR|nr:unnamed protein product [Moneuplotes crassus]
MNEMEIPRNYNEQDSFYQDKLLKSIDSYIPNKRPDNYEHIRVEKQEVGDYSIFSENKKEIPDQKYSPINFYNEKYDYSRERRRSSSNGTKFYECQDIRENNYFPNDDNLYQDLNLLSLHPPNHGKHRKMQSQAHKENYMLSSDLSCVLEDSNSMKNVEENFAEFNIQPYDTNKGKELLTITVEIGNGETEDLANNENEDPFKISEAFCTKHNIQEELKAAFTSQVFANISQVRKDITKEESKYLPLQKSPSVLTRVDNYYHSNTQKANTRDKMYLVDDLGEENYSMKLKHHRNQLSNSGFISKPCSNPQSNIRKNQESEDLRAKPMINEKSKFIANSKKTTNQSVHQRLHQQALSKQKIQKRSMNNCSFSTEKRFNVSELGKTEAKKKRKKKRKGKSLCGLSSKTFDHSTKLYHQGLQRMDDIEQRHLEAIAQKEQEELEHSFHPKINPYSYYFVQDDGSKPEDNLIKKGLISKDKKDQRRAEELYQKQMEFSYHPNINENSKKIIEERTTFLIDNCDHEIAKNYSLNPDQCHLLYEDAMKRVDRHNNVYSQCLDSECTFRPDIQRTRSNNITSRYDKGNSSKRDLQKLQNESYRRNYDPETGQPYFVPKVGRPPRDRRKNSKSIGYMFQKVR